MNISVDTRIESLVTGQKYWFSTSTTPRDLINGALSSSLKGVYCLWWKDLTTFPVSKKVKLPAGKRGVISVLLRAYHSELTKSVALYVGKGGIRVRLTSHVKPAKTRNPYQWLETVFPGADIDRLIKDNVGFSFVEEPNKLEQIYAENLAIGILRPWFNLRLTS